MDSRRAQAYGRVMKTLRAPEAQKLSENEQDEIRDAVDTLVFAHTRSECVVAVSCILDLAQQLVTSGRWPDRAADTLVDDVFGCGPQDAIGRPARRTGKASGKRRAVA